MQQGFTFEADDKPLDDIFFETNRRYRVPRYQRPYAWGIDQITQFWEDLISNDEPYYLGSFIFNTEQEREDGYVDIIDGQQRLLTITIFMAVIRDLAKNLDPKESEFYHRKDIAPEDWEGKSLYRIKPAETLESYFTKYVQNGKNNIQQSAPKTDEEKRVKVNYDFLKDKVSKEIERFQIKDGKIETLKKFRKKMRDLKIINVEISREEDAYDIFETTNARGMELSVSDLLKNLIFKNIKPGDDRDFAKDVWNEITKNIDETNTELKRFIRYFWISKYNFVQEKRLYKEIKKRIALSEWQTLLQDLWDDSNRFNDLLEGSETDFTKYKNGSKIFESIFAIRLMNVTQCYVLFLSILRNYAKLGFDPYRIFQVIAKFTFQYSVVCKLPGNRVEKIYSKYALEIENAAKKGPNERVTKKLNSIFDNLQNELKEVAPSEPLFMEYFNELEYKNSEENRKLIKYILGKINDHYRKTDEYLINFNTVNIEHLLPQNPDKEWNLSRKEIKEYVNKLGNLTLLSKTINSIIQNSIPSKKLPDLKNSELAITKKLVLLLEEINCIWGEEQINARQKEMAELAYKHIWHI